MATATFDLLAGVAFAFETAVVFEVPFRTAPDAVLVALVAFGSLNNKLLAWAAEIAYFLALAFDLVGFLP